MADYSVTVTKTGPKTYHWSTSKIEMSSGQTLAVKVGAGFAAGSTIGTVIFYSSPDKTGPELGKWVSGEASDPKLSGVVSVQATPGDAASVTLTDLWNDTTKDDDISFTVKIGADTPDPELVLKKKAGGSLAAGA